MVRAATPTRSCLDAALTSELPRLSHSHWGLRGMIERARRVGGQLQVQSAHAFDRVQRRLDQMPTLVESADKRAHVRNAQSLDGSDALPDENAAENANGDEPACSGVQPEARDPEDGSPPTDPGDPAC
jgi:hypothetical protein